jgi:hypothetical protein
MHNTNRHPYPKSWQVYSISIWPAFIGLPKALWYSRVKHIRTSVSRPYSSGSFGRSSHLQSVSELCPPVPSDSCPPDRWWAASDGRLVKKSAARRRRLSNSVSSAPTSGAVTLWGKTDLSWLSLLCQVVVAGIVSIDRVRINGERHDSNINLP